jgi:eukaryotic-like serine/threonine-protein kinase
LVSEPLVTSSSDTEQLRAHVDRVLSSQYELDREIGRGGMGIVYKAKDRRLKRHVAIKLLPPELAFRSEIRSRFLKEAETAAQLSHPNIVPIYTVDEREGLVYFVMAFVDGENLAARLHRSGRQPIDETRRILKEVAEALAYAHERGVVHRDIKPDNILLCVDDDSRVMVTDFGIARAVSEGADSRLTATGMAIGTPAYMSPEQSMGEREIDGRSDLYALGVVGYQMLTGELPFNASSTPALLVKQISERPMPVDEKRSDIPPDLSRAVMVLLEKEPANRFPSADAFVTALEQGTAPEPPSFRRDATPPTPMLASGYGNDVGDYRTTGTGTGGYGSVTSEEVSRWHAGPVVEFRKKLAPYIIVNSVIIVLAAFTGVDLVALTAVWSVYIAFKYARLWTEGYDWRDVFKQPKDRLFFDVVAESIDDFRALFDKKKRAEVLERDRTRARRRSLFGSDGPARVGSGSPTGNSGGGRAELSQIAGAHAGTVRRAQHHRDEIIRLVETLPKREREHIADVPSSALALYQRIEGLAMNLADLERSAKPGDAEVVEQEIARLEAQANPLDHAASEERIKRLAYLRRQRAAVAGTLGRRTQLASKLESCALALQNMQLDVIRLQAGGQSYQQVTLLAERAMSLAREVDNQVYVADEMAKLRGGREARGGRM